MKRRKTRAFLSALCILLAACASTQARKKTDESRAHQYYRLAQADFSQGRNQDAITHLKKALDLDPDDPDVHNYLGVVYFLLSDYANAEKELSEALKLNPYLTDARNSLGAVYMKTDRRDRARDTFEEALKDKTFPNPERILYNLGTLQLDEKRYPEALDTFRRAVAANASYAKGYYGLGLALAGSGRAEDARMNFQKVISMDPNSPEAARARELLAQAPARKKG